MDLDIFLPVAKKDFARVLEMVENSTDPDAAARKLWNYINGKIEPLRTLRDSENNAKQKAKRTKELNKWLALASMLSDKFQFEAVEKDPEKVRFTKCDVFRMVVPGKIDVVSGWKFKKFGLDFAIFKDPGRKIYRVLLPCVGLLVAADGSSKPEAVAALTEGLFTKVKEAFSNPKFEGMRRQFCDKMTEAGFYATLCTDPLYSVPEVGQNATEAAGPKACTPAEEARREAATAAATTTTAETAARPAEGPTTVAETAVGENMPISTAEARTTADNGSRERILQRTGPARHNGLKNRPDIGSTEKRHAPQRATMRHNAKNGRGYILARPAAKNAARDATTGKGSDPARPAAFRQWEAGPPAVHRDRGRGSRWHFSKLKRLGFPVPGGWIFGPPKLPAASSLIMCTHTRTHIYAHENIRGSPSLITCTLVHDKYNANCVDNARRISCRSCTAQRVK